MRRKRKERERKRKRKLKEQKRRIEGDCEPESEQERSQSCPCATGLAQTISYVKIPLVEQKKTKAKEIVKIVQKIQQKFERFDKLFTGFNSSSKVDKLFQGDPSERLRTMKFLHFMVIYIDNTQLTLVQSSTIKDLNDIQKKLEDIRSLNTCLDPKLPEFAKKIHKNLVLNLLKVLADARTRVRTLRAILSEKLCSPEITQAASNNSNHYKSAVDVITNLGKLSAHLQMSQEKLFKKIDWIQISFNPTMDCMKKQVEANENKSKCCEEGKCLGDCMYQSKKADSWGESDSDNEQAFKKIDQGEQMIEGIDDLKNLDPVAILE